MSLSVKICGITDAESLEAATGNGAAYTGFVFYPQSRHAIRPEAARDLALRIPQGVVKTGLFVNATDDFIRAVTQIVPLDLLQLHGDETPARIAEIRRRFGLPVMAALRIAASEHLAPVAAYEEVADRLLFDTRIGEAPSGGTGKSFDWGLLSGHIFKKPWMLAGGLNARNLAEAVRRSGAKAVDVSSGVEDEQGHKSPAKIREFLDKAKTL